MSKEKEKNFIDDFLSLGPYFVDCIDGIAHRVKKNDIIITAIILISIAWFRHELASNYQLIEIEIDAYVFIYNCMAELWNILMPIFKFIVHIFEDIEHVLPISLPFIESITQLLEAIVSVRLYIFKISDVNKVLSGLGNSRDFVSASEIKNVISWLFGNTLCYTARVLDPTILSPVSHILSIGFHGGYKPDPSSETENCMIQSTIPFFYDSWLTILLFSVQCVETALIIYIIIQIWYVLRNPKKYIR